MTTKEPVHFNDSSFKTEVLESPQPVLVDFWAEWCQPCHALAPTIKQLADEYAGSVKVGKLNIEESPATAAAYGIRSIPSVLVFKGGQVVAQLVGVRDKKSYAEALDQAQESGTSR
jgi:thioredoxin 1